MTKQKAAQTAIYNARIVCPDKVINSGWLLIENGKIASWDKGRKTFARGIKKIDASGNYIAPGLIDLHVHGSIGKLSRTLLKQGTTGFLHTLHADSPKGLDRQMDESRKETLNGANCLGFNIEGPFINKEMAGAQPRRFILTPEGKLLLPLLKKYPRQIKIMTVACEIKGADRLIEMLKKAGVVVALGHSAATFEQARRAADMGVHYATHTFNRMGTLSARAPGLIGEVLLDKRITAEVIADGYHVHPALLRFLVKNKGTENIVLISDSVAAMEQPGLRIDGGVYRMKNGTIAGSKLTLIKAVKNMIDYCDVSLPQAVNMASLNPAKIIGRDNVKGRLEKGFDADIIMFDDKYRIKSVILDGKTVFGKNAS